MHFVLQLQMAMCVPRPMSVRLTMDPRPTMPDRDFSLSFDDIRLFTERERLQTRQRSRRHTVETAHVEKLAKAPKITPRPILKDIHAKGDGTPGGLRQCQREPTQESITSRHCCDVLGPGLCHECTLLLRRQFHLHRMSYTFSSLNLSERNLAMTTILNRYLPNLTPNQIESKLMHGDINVATPIRPRSPNHFSREISLSTLPKDKKSRLLPNVANNGPSATFFSGIADLNHKIVSGKVPRRIDLTGGVIKEEQRLKSVADKLIQKKRMRSLTEKLCPAFVSPKKMEKLMEERSKYGTTNFDPPMVAKESQNAEPTFFAGSEIEYVLPDRLPEVVLPDIEEGAWTGSPTTSASYSRPPSTPTTPKPPSTPSTPQISDHPTYGLSNA